MKNIKVIFVMMLWGSIAVLTRFITLSPLSLAGLRALIALPVLGFFMVVKKRPIRQELNFKNNIITYISGGLIGVAWVLLFLAYRNTSIANATVTYNMCPIYVMLLTPFVLKEKLNKINIITILLAFTGIIIIVLNSISVSIQDTKGISYGLLSGFLYAIIVVLNRKYNSKISSETSTFIQLFMALVILLPIMIFDKPLIQIMALDQWQVLSLVTLGVVHTGIAYYLYFSSYKDMSAVSIALLSYLEPVFAIFFGILFIGENLNLSTFIGCLLIIGSTLGKDIYENLIAALKTKGQKEASNA